MKNIELSVNGNELTIKVNLAKSFGDSKSGKTTIIASSEGGVKVPGHEDIRMGLNVYRQK